MTPTPEQIDVFRKVEEEAQYGSSVHDEELTSAEFLTALQLTGLGYLLRGHGDFEITAKGQAAFADCGR